MRMTVERSAIIFEIQRFSIHDGPGIRTTVFLKGCNLRCKWCHNPESSHPYPELMFYASKCIKCLSCVNECRHGALIFDGKKIKYLPENCRKCFRCAGVCPVEAIVRCGREMDTAEVCREVLKDRNYYETSGGGVTVSGGEPLLHPEFTASLFSLLKKEGISTCVETAGCVPWKNIRKILPFTDIFLYDVKSGNREKLAGSAGADMTLVTENLKNLLAGGVKIFVRIPLIPGFNTERRELKKILDILKGLPGQFEMELLKYNGLGTAKYEALNIPSPLRKIPATEADKSYEAAREFFRDEGYNV